MVNLAAAFKDLVSFGLSAAVDERSKLINASTLNDYPTLRRLWPGKPDQLWVQGGNNLVSWIQLEYDDQSADYGINDTLPPTRNPQTSTKIQSEWRLRYNTMGWTDFEVVTNLSAAGANGNFRQPFKDEKNKVVQNYFTGWFEGLEKMLWATPDKSLMESSTVSTGKPFSIPVWMNENTNGLFPSVSPGGAWTTKAGVDPTASGKTLWDNQRFTYNTMNLKSTTSTDIPVNIAMVQAYKKTKFTPPPDRQQYFENDELRAQVIWCDMPSLMSLTRAYSAYGDIFAGYGNDPTTAKPMFFGIDLEWVPVLDTAVLYMNSGSTALAGVGAYGSTGLLKNGGRYYFHKGGGFKYAVHRDRWLHMTEPKNPERQPFAWVVYGDLWHQNHPLNLRKLALVSPSVTNAW